MNFGAYVASRDDEVVGTIERLIIDRSTSEVLSCVVHSTVGRERDVVVPISAIRDIDDGITLNLSAPEVENLPDHSFAKLSSGMGMPGLEAPASSDVVEFSARTQVECEDGELGTLIGLEVDEFTAEAGELLVRRQDRTSTDEQSIAAIPLAWASSLRSDRIKLQCSRADI